MNDLNALCEVIREVIAELERGEIGGAASQKLRQILNSPSPWKYRRGCNEQT
jgi:hypothetical protein